MPFDAAYLEAYLHENIPLTRSMGIKVDVAALDRVILSAPLQANINHHHTVFGGSLHAVATLSCWSLVFVNLMQFQPPVDIVIFHSEVNYLLPVKGDFTAEGFNPSPEGWHKMTEMIKRKGKGRIGLKGSIFYEGKLAVDYSGDFVALAKS